MDEPRVTGPLPNGISQTALATARFLTSNVAGPLSHALHRGDLGPWEPGGFPCVGQRLANPDKGSQPDPFGFGGGDFDMNNLGQIFSKLGEMFSGAGTSMAGGAQSGPVNYDLARQLASSSIGFVKPVPEKTSAAVADAVRLADTWLDGVTPLPAGTTKAVAWTPSEWVDNTLATWKRLCDPVAEQMSTVWASALPEEAKAMAGPLMAMMTQMGGMAFGSQLGQALGTLSREVLTSTDIGLAAGPQGRGRADAGGHRDPRRGARAAAQRDHDVPRRPRGRAPPPVQPRAVAVDPVAQRRRGLRPRHEGRHERHRGPRRRASTPPRSADPSAMEQLLNQGIFEPKSTPEQVAALERLETLLALIEGWVQTVVTAALGDRIPGAVGAERDAAPPPRHRRARRADLRDAGRTGTAAAQAARGRGAVGAADRGRRRRRPRRGVAAPRPAARRRRPRRTRRLHRPRGRRRHQRHRPGDRRSREGLRRRRPRAPDAGPVDN